MEMGRVRTAAVAAQSRAAGRAAAVRRNAVTVRQTVRHADRATVDGRTRASRAVAGSASGGGESTRERSETRSSTADRSRESRGGESWRNESRDGATRSERSFDRSERDSGRTDRSFDRNDRSTRSNDRSYGRNESRSNGSYGRNDRSYGRSDRSYGRNDRSYGNRSYGNRTPYYASGRVSRIHRYGSGYRIYIVGSPYPFFIPEVYYRSGRFRVGLSIRLGGYYNPLGYYDYYDGDYYDGRSASVGGLRGVVESVDYRRDTFVVRNDATGSFVTVVARDRRQVRPGDYVELSGEWNRSGLFQAYDIDLLDEARR